MGAGQVQIRRAAVDDCAAIADLLYRSFVEFKHLYTHGGFAATTPAAVQVGTRMQEGPVWVALSRGVMVGTVAAVKKGDSVYIRGMAVLPAQRGLGAGSKLLEEVENWAAEQGLTRLFLSTTPFLDSAIRLYERSGFRRTDDGPHDLFGTPLFTMEKLTRAQVPG
ncbi:MAG: GNAT family N-acetyltransferase [Acidobacteriia bacterium]|nr:GNAT family N-acetyltransferase [Terriglobia bacterium]